MKKNVKGFSLIVCVLLISVLMPLVIAYISRVATEYRLTAKFYSSICAIELAEAGVERAIWEINHNNLTVARNTTYTISIPASSLKASNGQSIGDTSIDIYLNPIGNTYTITSTGYVPSSSSPSEKRTVEVQFIKNYNFTKAIVANGNVTLNGQSIIDSYDSAKGAYNSDKGSQLYNAGQQGGVETNGKFILNGSPPPGFDYFINGDANPGPGNPVDPSYYKWISGSHSTLQAPVQIDPIPDATMAAAKLSNNNASIDTQILAPGTYNLSLNGQQTLALAPGTYYFTSISLNGQAAIQISGPTTIYVQNGSMNINGQGFINTGQPRNLVILSTGSSINLNGQADFSGAIYAPNSTLTLNGQGQIYGAVVCGKEAENGQSGVHYDVDLLRVPPPGFGDYQITYWQEKT